MHVHRPSFAVTHMKMCIISITFSHTHTHCVNQPINQPRIYNNTTQEEQEWHDLLAKVQTLDIKPPSNDSEQAAHNTAAAVDSLAGEEIAALQALQHDVHRRLTLQVDAVCMLIGNMEDLIEKAQDTMHEAQTQLHAQRLKAFPHVYSPARLIRAIVRPETAAGEGQHGDDGA